MIEFLVCGSFKVTTRTACTGEHIVLMFILEFVPGISLLLIAESDFVS